MYELVQAVGNSYYIECPAKIGVVKINDDEVVLIDSGNDKDAGKKAFRIITENGWKLKTIFNTHSHADHIGGNAYLQKQTGCGIYAPGVEHAFAQYTILEPVGLYGGNPINDLKSKFTMAQPSDTQILTDSVLPCNMNIIPLPGHSFDQVGFMTDDGAAYIADSIASSETIEKYKITFLFDVAQYLDTLEALRNIKAHVFIPAHAPAMEDINEIVDVNVESVGRISELIWNLCKEPVCTDDLMKKVFDALDLKMSVLQYALLGNTIRSYLSWLKTRDKAEIIIEDNRLLWRSI